MAHRSRIDESKSKLSAKAKEWGVAVNSGDELIILEAWIAMMHATIDLMDLVGHYETAVFCRHINHRPPLTTETTTPA